jgi:hypothetical protein
LEERELTSHRDLSLRYSNVSTACPSLLHAYENSQCLWNAPKKGHAIHPKGIAGSYADNENKNGMVNAHQKRYASRKDHNRSEH